MVNMVQTGTGNPRLVRAFRRIGGMWTCLGEMMRCQRVRLRYAQRLCKVRSAFGHRPLRVLFSVNNLAKWKMQSLLELMNKSSRYTPIVAVTLMDMELQYSKANKSAALASMETYFKVRGFQTVRAYDLEKNEAIPFGNFSPDIVFYQQPWGISRCQRPSAVSRYALTCYVPYFVIGFLDLKCHCRQRFHRMLWRHFILNEEWERIFMREQGVLGRAGRVIGSGHPMLDRFRVEKDLQQDGSVIYAPHWTCHVGMCWSTFLEMGEKVLKLAKAHPEIPWVFKPHPSLAHVLVQQCRWSAEKVDAYYREWEKVGRVCLDGEYVELFQRSRAMITDCGSFLVEYACVGKPIIHLVSGDSNQFPLAAMPDLYKTYYQAKNWEELLTCFERIVCNGEDCQKEARLAQVKKVGLLGNCAAENIIAHLNETFGRKEMRQLPRME